MSNVLTYQTLIYNTFTNLLIQHISQLTSINLKKLLIYYCKESLFK